MPQTSSRFQPKAITLAVLLAFSLPTISVHAQSAPASVRSYAIPAGSMEEVLTRFTANAGIALSFDPAIVAGLRSNGLSGNYTKEQGLQRILLDSGLVAEPRSDGSYTLHKRSVSAIKNEATLAPVTVTATLNATTEGSGSYAAQAASIFKGAKSLKDIPQSISVMTRQQMDDQGITRLDQAYTQMPGVRMDGYADIARVFARGFQVSTQLDGVPFGEESFYQLDPAIYDRVEMLRGPAGLLAGSGEPGGTLNLVRKRPRDKFAFSGSVSYGSWNDVRTELDISSPLNESGTLRGRAVAVFQDRDQFYDFASDRRSLFYGILELDLTSRDTVGLSVTRMERVGNSYYGVPRYSDGSLPGRNTFVGATDVPTTRDTTDVMLDYQHRFDNGWVGKATFGARDEKFTNAGFFGYTSVNVNTGLGMGGATYTNNTEKYNAFDLNFSGPFNLLGRTHQATFGFNQSVREVEMQNWLSRFFASTDVLNNHNWGGSSRVWPASGDAFRTKQSGFYGSLNFRLTEPLSLMVGGRLTDFDYRSRSNYQSPWRDGQKASQQFTPYAGLVYDLNKQISLYGSYSEIFVPQSVRNYLGNMIEPRTGEQFELGIKGAFLNKKLNASLAVYQLQDENRAIDDMDPTHVCPGVGTGRCSMAIGKVRSRGFEAEVSGAPTSRLSLSASYTFNRTKYLGTPDSNLGTTQFFSWRTPKHLAKLWAQYRFADDTNLTTPGIWTVGGGIIAQSALVDDRAYLSRIYRQGGYAVVSTRVGYQVNKNMNLNLDVDNVFDKTYLVNLGDDAYYNIYGKPRNFRLTMNYKFD